MGLQRQRPLSGLPAADIQLRGADAQPVHPARGGIQVAKGARRPLGGGGNQPCVADQLWVRDSSWDPGYRVYFMQRGAVLVVVLARGDKRTQHIDIKAAQRVAADWERGS